MTSKGEADPARDVRRLLRGAATATLATVGSEGWPYASLVLVAADHDATPLLLLSDLAEHSRNIAADDRVSLLVDDTAGLDDPLTGSRASIAARAARTAEPRHRARYLARHGSARDYADFGDFAFYRLDVESAHLVAGFGRIHTVPAAALRVDAPAALIEAEAGILEHMNADHADAVALYASRLLGTGDTGGTGDKDGEGARLVGIDPEGCDIRAGARLLRLDFDAPIADAGDARRTLVALAGG